ncbi:ATP-binding protein [Sungkyunkwania multivorans]|uniref:histidine kinase n=1 Tax=Sungkyunkwania multivorans TaxID=1173618 RepID=A0ABW3D0P0_9FLAO
MNNPRSITPKLVFSYVLFVILTGIAVGIVYKGIMKITLTSDDLEVDHKKTLAIGNILSDLYASEGLARSATQTASWSRYDQFVASSDTVKMEINALQALLDNPSQIAQLDSTLQLIDKKIKNIETLVQLKREHASKEIVEKAKQELYKLENSLGGVNREDFVSNPDELNSEELRKIDLLIEYINNSVTDKDIDQIDKAKFDSLINATKDIVEDLQRESEALQKTMKRKELQLLQNDITISQQLRQLLSVIETEIFLNTIKEDTHRQNAVNATSKNLSIIGLGSLALILIFSFMILKDFSKSEKYRKQLEAEKNFSESLLDSRERLINTVSHDLRAPLNAMVGYIELLHRPNQIEQRKTYYTRLKESISYASKLLNNLLDYSKLEAGKMTIEKETFNLKELIDETAHSVKILYSQKPVDLILEVEKVLDATYISDPFRLKQVLTNLIANAFKFTSEGAITITASVTRTLKNCVLVSIKVKDTGIGIEKEQQEMIFKEFAQAGIGIERSYGGSGLGLTISRKIIALLDGDISLESEKNIGSTFTVTLPLQKVGEKNERPLAQSDSTKKIPSKDPVAVIVDDDESQLALLGELLQSQNIRHIAFSDPREALKELENERFDIVFTDIMMPQMNGVDFMRKLKGAGFYRRQPVVAITGNHNAKSFIGKGFSYYIQKPFYAYQLIKAINHFSELADKVIPNSIEPMTTHLYNIDRSYDLSNLRELLQDDETAMRKIINTFIENTKQNIIGLRKAIKEKDIVYIKDIAHRMSPMFKQLNALHVYKLLDELEHFSIAQSSYEGLRLKLEKVIERMNALIEELQAEFKT